MPSVQKQKRVRCLSLPGGRSLSFERTLVMGVLNVTPDSFSDGGRFATAETALSRAIEMESQGADIIDIGGESSRPGARPVESSEEIARVLPVIEAIRCRSQVPLSIDTYHADTAEKAVEAGADIVNDISAMRFDSRMIAVARNKNIPVVLMHMQGDPRTMQNRPTYDDCVQEVIRYLEERLSFCVGAGISASHIILDPGIGFGKRVQDNLAILADLEAFQALECPIMIGASRKSFIGKVHGDRVDASERVGGSIAAALIAASKGADIVRVHDVAETVQALRVAEAIESAR